MTHGSQGDPCDLIGVLASKGNTPRQGTFRPITASGGKASQATETVPQGQGRADEVGRLPKGDLVLPHIEDGKEDTEGQASLEHPPGTGQAEQL